MKLILEVGTATGILDTRMSSELGKTRPEEWFAHMMISTDHTNNLVAYLRIHDCDRIPVQVIYFAFLPNVEHLAI
jgi:hypothetical protein